MTLLSILLLILVAIVAFLNMNTIVPTNLYFDTIDIPMWLLITLATAAGALAVFLIMGARAAHNKKEERRRREQEEAEAEQRRKEEELREREIAAKHQLKEKDSEIEQLQARLSSLESRLTREEQLSKQNVQTSTGPTIHTDTHTDVVRDIDDGTTNTATIRKTTVDSQ